MKISTVPFLDYFLNIKAGFWLERIMVRNMLWLYSIGWLVGSVLCPIDSEVI